MKKIKLFTLALAALFAGYVLAADYAPTKVFSVGNETTLGAKWADKGQPANYFVSGDTIVFTPFLCYQSGGAGKQEWTGNAAPASLRILGFLGRKRAIVKKIFLKKNL